jgi:hypothetical protein
MKICRRRPAFHFELLFPYLFSFVETPADGVDRTQKAHKSTVRVVPMSLFEFSFSGVAERTYVRITRQYLESAIPCPSCRSRRRNEAKRFVNQ